MKSHGWLDVRTEERLTALATRVVQELGYELYHIGYKKAGSRSTVRLYIDQPRGVTLGDCERVSRALAAALETEDIVPERYVLEVSSPGLDRPLFRERDYERFVGNSARVSMLEPIDGRRHFKGTIRSCSRGKLVLSQDDGSEVELSLSQVSDGHLEPEF